MDRRMAPGRAVSKAREILRRVGPDVPVDVEALAETHGVSVVQQDLEDSVSGILVIKDGHGIIGVNQNHHPNRRRFTIGHELGHYILHRKNAKVFVDASPVFFRDTASSDGMQSQEIAANAFAAELLMPEDAVHEYIGNQLVDVYDDATVRRLAARFGVSVQAITIRLIRLGLAE
jgi:Zn-dependent peptidase ImmA (M78 family)